MKIPLFQFLPLFGTFLVLVFGTSCTNLGKADREFKTNSLYSPPEFSNAEPVVEGEIAARIAEEPDFEQLKFDKSIDSHLLQPPRGAYRVGPGDILDIEVAENIATRQQVRVLPDGMLYYDVARGINVKGRTLKDISLALAQLLEEDYVNPVVTVNVANADSQRFWILGQVRQPGTYSIKKPTTVVDALSIGGGLLSNDRGEEVGNPEAADLERAILIRDGDLIPVDFYSLIHEGDMSQNVYVKGGDYIFIPSLTARSVYVLGEVAQPGPVYYETGTTLLSAVASVGGLNKDAIGSKALILRGGTRNPQAAVVNINAIRKGKEPDLKVEGGDIIWVPKTAWTKLNEYVEAVLITAGQAVAVQEGLAVLGATGDAGVTIQAGGGN